MEVQKNMARIAGVDLPREKRAEIGLTYIYGIGKATANEILAKAEIDPNVRIKDLSEEQIYDLLWNYIKDVNKKLYLL